ncbi:hypothetical protein EGW08_008867 [Elysia chlorotica]|uniref:Uncharacterized protein n=1 Tax=Elysia chlorotica TaxID=188477 RepID=A0A433TP65_ELYCH|nr:hypothetical protein EGW08_008867 [Elysia chlorotica]
MKVAVALLLTLAVSLVSAASIETRFIGNFFKDTWSNIKSATTNAWNKVSNTVSDYNIGDRLGQIKDKIQAKYGDITSDMNNVTFVDIAKAAKDVFVDSEQILGVDVVKSKVIEAIKEKSDIMFNDAINKAVEGVVEDIASSISFGGTE